jgi:predicted TIM-barrel fold metal-dependent hydrolase
VTIPGPALAHADPGRGAAAADALVEPWFSCLRERLGDLRIFDCHTHLGCADPDGSCFDAGELLQALDAVDGRAIVFPLAEPHGYRRANDRILATAEDSGGRLVAFCRVDPRNGASAELERAVGRGAAGIKLHPRGERFGLADGAVKRIFEVVDERALPIIVHAGRGIPSLGHDALELARSYPRVPLILAHAAIADLAWIWHEAAGQRNLFFDTAWWNTADQLALFALLPPGQILFASDMPYGRVVAAASVALRAALAVGLTADQIAVIAGGQLERLLAGMQPLDLGPAPSVAAPAPGPLLERMHSLLVAAAARMTAGYPADEYLELARLASKLPAGHPQAEIASSVRGLLDRHAAHLATKPPQGGPRVPGIHLIFVAAAVARTPGLPLPRDLV